MYQDAYIGGTFQYVNVYYNNVLILYDFTEATDHILDTSTL